MPKTGDNTNIGKWIAVICVSGCAVLLIIGFCQKKTEDRIKNKILNSGGRPKKIFYRTAVFCKG